MTLLVCGSLAFDTLMQHQGKFSEVLLPEDLHRINVCFLAKTLQRSFGGCAGNIAYNLALLGADCAIIASAGQDIAPYLNYLCRLGIDCTGVAVHPEAYTAQCFITTDAAQNQITVFHPGAMDFSHENIIPETQKISYGIVAPDGREGMLRHAAWFAARNIPFIFDPGQGLPMFDAKELLHFLDLASCVIVNDYEYALLLERTGLQKTQLAQRVRAMIVTHGEKGCTITVDRKDLVIAPVPAQRVLDPTGCGDAFRAGLLFALDKNLDWETAGRLGNLMGCLKVEYAGTQKHAPKINEIRQRFTAAFGQAWPFS